jgi:hypothetical protein
MTGQDFVCEAVFVLDDERPAVWHPRNHVRVVILHTVGVVNHFVQHLGKSGFLAAAAAAAAMTRGGSTSSSTPNGTIFWTIYVQRGAGVELVPTIEGGLTKITIVGIAVFVVVVVGRGGGRGGIAVLLLVARRQCLLGLGRRSALGLVVVAVSVAVGGRSRNRHGEYLCERTSFAGDRLAGRGEIVLQQTTGVQISKMPAHCFSSFYGEICAYLLNRYHGEMRSAGRMQSKPQIADATPGAEGGRIVLAIEVLPFAVLLGGYKLLRT